MPKGSSVCQPPISWDFGRNQHYGMMYMPLKISRATSHVNVTRHNSTYLWNLSKELNHPY